jgi:hypothetical protein
MNEAFHELVFLISAVRSEGFAVHIGAGCVWQHKVCQASLPWVTGNQECDSRQSNDYASRDGTLHAKPNRHAVPGEETVSIEGRMSRRRFLGGAGAAALGAAGSIACPRLVFAQNKKSLQFTLPWVAEGSNLFTFVAKGMGFWEKHGLDVDIARGSGSV